MGIESNSFGDVLIAGTVTFGVFGVLAAAIFFYMSSFSYEKAKDDTVKERTHKNRRFAQRLMAMFGAAALGVLAAGYLFVLFKIGTLVRSDGQTVNWTYFAFASAAWFLLGLLHSIFFRLDGYSRRVTLGVLFLLPALLLALAPLSPHLDKRNVCFGFAVALQAVSLFFIFWFEGVAGPLKRLYGWIVAAGVLIAFILYDTFFYIGYLNETASAVVLSSRWNAQVAFLIADFLAFVVSAALAFWLYRPKREDEAAAAIAVLPSASAGLAVGPTGAGAYASVNGVELQL